MKPTTKWQFPSGNDSSPGFKFAKEGVEGGETGSDGCSKWHFQLIAFIITVVLLIKLYHVDGFQNKHLMGETGSSFFQAGQLGSKVKKTGSVEEEEAVTPTIPKVELYMMAGLTLARALEGEALGAALHLSSGSSHDGPKDTDTSSVETTAAHVALDHHSSGTHECEPRASDGPHLEEETDLTEIRSSSRETRHDAREITHGELKLPEPASGHNEVPQTKADGATPVALQPLTPPSVSETAVIAPTPTIDGDTKATAGCLSLDDHGVVQSSADVHGFCHSPDDVEKKEARTDSSGSAEPSMGGLSKMLVQTLGGGVRTGRLRTGLSATRDKSDDALKSSQKQAQEQGLDQQKPCESAPGEEKAVLTGVASQPAVGAHDGLPKPALRRSDEKGSTKEAKDSPASVGPHNPPILHRACVRLLGPEDPCCPHFWGTDHDDDKHLTALTDRRACLKVSVANETKDQQWSFPTFNSLRYLGGRLKTLFSSRDADEAKQHITYGYLPDPAVVCRKAVGLKTRIGDGVRGVARETLRSRRETRATAPTRTPNIAPKSHRLPPTSRVDPPSMERVEASQQVTSLPTPASRPMGARGGLGARRARLRATMRAVPARAVPAISVLSTRAGSSARVGSRTGFKARRAGLRARRAGLRARRTGFRAGLGSRSRVGLRARRAGLRARRAGLRARRAGLRARQRLKSSNVIRELV